MSTDSKGQLAYWMDAIRFGATANAFTMGPVSGGTGPITYAATTNLWHRDRR